MEVMQWQTIINGLLGSSPVAAALGFACYKLWAKVEAQDKEIQELNRQNLEFLKTLLQRPKD